MVTDDEIDRRVKDKDTSRSARRSAAAKRIAQLAQQHALLSAQLRDVERDIGDALVEAHDVIDLAELHEFTEVPTADLDRWVTAYTTTRSSRGKRKRPVTNTAGGASGRGEESSITAKPTGTSTARAARPRPDTAPVREPAHVT